MVTQQQIETNLRNVEEGISLTIPLKILDGEFKKRYYKRNKLKIKIITHKVCPICKKEFIPKTRLIFCSPTCRKKYKEIRMLKKCKMCSKIFLRKWGYEKYCKDCNKFVNSRKLLIKKVKELMEEKNKPIS